MKKECTLFNKPKDELIVYRVRDYNIIDLHLSTGVYFLLEKFRSNELLLRKCVISIEQYT